MRVSGTVAWFCRPVVYLCRPDVGLCRLFSKTASEFPRHFNLQEDHKHDSVYHSTGPLVLSRDWTMTGRDWGSNVHLGRRMTFREDSGNMSFSLQHSVFLSLLPFVLCFPF